MKIVIDKERCFMSGECYYNHPEIFRMDDDGYPVVLLDLTEEQSLEQVPKQVSEAIEVCPALAISLTV